MEKTMDRKSMDQAVWKMLFLLLSSIMMNADMTRGQGLSVIGSSLTPIEEPMALRWPILTSSDELVASVPADNRVAPDGEILDLKIAVRLVKLPGGAANDFIKKVGPFISKEANLVSSYSGADGRRYILDQNTDPPRLYCADPHGNLVIDRVLPSGARYAAYYPSFTVDSKGVPTLLTYDPGKSHSTGIQTIVLSRDDPPYAIVFRPDGSRFPSRILMNQGKERVSGSVGVLPDDSTLVPVMIRNGDFVTGELRVYAPTGAVARVFSGDQLLSTVAPFAPKGSHATAALPLACDANHAAVHVLVRDDESGRVRPFVALLVVSL